MKIRPVADKILIQYLEVKSKTPGGIILPDSAKKKPQRGKVINVGTLIKIKIKQDDIVIFQNHVGTDIKIGKEEYLIIDESDILAVIEDL